MLLGLTYDGVDNDGIGVALAVVDNSGLATAAAGVGMAGMAALALSCSILSFCVHLKINKKNFESRLSNFKKLIYIKYLTFYVFYITPA